MKKKSVKPSKDRSNNIKSNKSKSSKVKCIIIFVIILIILILSFMIYLNLFNNTSSNRFKDIENYKLTKEEKNSVKEKIKELENIEEVDIYTNSKIIRIFIKLTDDIDFDQIKTVSNSLLEEFSNENLSYYDVEVFVESKNEESDIYPKIGYKHKTSEEFVW